MTEIFQRHQRLVVCLCLAAVTAVVYWPVRHFEFVNYDDFQYVTDNPHVRGGLTLEGVAWAFTTPYASYWLPLSWLSHMLVCALFGLNAGAHHAVNVLLHITNALLLFVVLNRMTAAPWRSAFVAALFAWHPLHVESVAWVSERKDMLCGLFWMLALWAYVRYAEQPGRGRYWLTVGLFALGLMCKPMLVTLPFVLLLLDYWPLGRTRWAKSAVGDKPKASLGQLLTEKLPFVALAVASSAVTFWAQQSGGSVQSLVAVPVGLRAANAAVSYVRYIGKTIWPVELAVFYPYKTWAPWAVWGAVALVVGVSGWVIWRARREPHLFTGWLWYLGTLVPVIGLVQVGEQSMADRYTYLPLIGLFVMAAWDVPVSAMERPARRIAVAATAMALLGACALNCRLQVRHWKDSVTLFRHALAVTRENFLANMNLAAALLDQDKPQEAIRYFEQALRIMPGYADAHHGLGFALIRVGRVTEAIGHLEPVVALRPNSVEAHYDLGLALALLGRPEEAAQQFEEVIRIQPQHAQAHFSLGVALVEAGRVQEAIGQYKQAIQIRGNHADALNNLAWVLATEEDERLRDPVQAVQFAERACELTARKDPWFLDTLAAAYAEAGRFDEAVRTAQEALNLASAAGHEGLAQGLASRLELYKAGQPFRRKPTVAPNA